MPLKESVFVLKFCLLKCFLIHNIFLFFHLAHTQIQGFLTCKQATYSCPCAKHGFYKFNQHTLVAISRRGKGRWSCRQSLSSCFEGEVCKISSRSECRATPDTPASTRFNFFNFQNHREHVSNNLWKLHRHRMNGVCSYTRHRHTYFDLYIYIKLADSPCFATVNLYLLRKVKVMNFPLLMHYYVNYGQLLNYVYIDICPRRRLHRMFAFKKGKNSLSHERYSFKYTPSDKTNGLLEYVIKFPFKNVLNHFGGLCQNNQVLGWAYNANTPCKTALRETV